jgi:hypothetical protein
VHPLHRAQNLHFYLLKRDSHQTRYLISLCNLFFASRDGCLNVAGLHRIQCALLTDHFHCCRILRCCRKVGQVQLVFEPVPRRLDELIRACCRRYATSAPPCCCTHRIRVGAVVTARVCELGHRQWLGCEDTDGICGLEKVCKVHTLRRQRRSFLAAAH